ncbi:MAG TPA: acyl-CoA dehydrogenase family protein [Candidatus Binatia bacterium]|jgi:alkylation response protein AidB-like acyl-CoA dehydrogenase
MDFDFNQDQELIKKTAREFLASECPARVVRETENRGGYSPELWKKMADLGWTGLPVAEEFGGSGAGFLDMCILVEEIGRALAPVPLISHALCEYALIDAGSAEQKKRLLPPMAAGTRIMTPALNDVTLSFHPAAIECRAEKKGDGYAIRGTKLLVPYGAIADAYLVAARTGGAGETGISLFIVDREQKGVSATPVPTIAVDARCDLQLDNVEVGRAALLGGEGHGWPVLSKLLQRGAALTCAEMAGGAQAVLERTLAYVKDRVQFDRPVGSFQAVQHRCANMAVACDGARFATYQAAWRLNENLPCEREVAIAKAWTSDAYTKICFDGHQAHGAIGFTKEYDLQLYTRRAKAAELAYGDTRHHSELLADLLGLDDTKGL